MIKKGYVVILSLCVKSSDVFIFVLFMCLELQIVFLIFKFIEFFERGFYLGLI